MQEAVTRFVDMCFKNTKELSGQASVPHGLTLIDMPTGSGKTYNTIEMIVKYLKGELFQDVKRIFYLTPLNKNVKDAYDNLKDRMNKEGQDDLFDSNCLWLRANYQAVIDNFKDVETDIPNEYKKDSYYNLKKFITGYTEVSSKSSDNIADTKLTFENEIREKLEPAFRRDLKLILNRHYRTKEEKLKKVRDDWKWILKLYPSILTEKRRVLFMSVDKFFMINDPIISRPYNFINSNLIKGALVFIDEFDASKEFILRSQIKQCAQKKLDLIKYMSTLSSVFASNKKMPNELFPKPKDGNHKKSSKYAFDELRLVVLDCRTDKKLDYHFKLDISEKEKRCFIFLDDDLHTISNTKDTPRFNLHIDENRNLNIIELGKASASGKKFYDLIYSLTGALHFSLRAFSMMAKNYLNYFNNEKRSQDDDMMIPEEAISTVLSPFELDNEIQTAISKIITSSFNFPIKRKNRLIGETFYTTGFKYFDFVDDLSHDTTTSINMCFLDDTPERFMYSLASAAMVVGISATATIRTVTGNYNLDYLKKRLGKYFIPLCSEDFERISNKFKNLYKEGRDYKVNVNVVSSKSEEDEELSKEIFKNQDYIDNLCTVISAFGTKKYEKKRYIKLLISIKRFIENLNSKAMLVITNNNLKTTNGVHPFSKEIMNSLIAQIRTECKISNEIAVHILHGNIYEQEKKGYQEDIRKGKKVILFTSYPASGTGQNLQYSIMEGADEKAELQKDIDSIYLEKPTNILVNINIDRSNDDAFLTEEDLIKYIYQTESLKFEGEVSGTDSLNMIKKAFKAFMKGERYSTKQNKANEYNTDSVNNHILRTLVQAVGRICRTRDKNKLDVNIYLDEDIYDKVSFEPIKDKPMNKEFRAIVNGSSNKSWSEKNSPETKVLNKAENNSYVLADRLKALIKKNEVFWLQDDMNDWKAVRDWLLKHPTVSEKELENNKDYESFYLTLPVGYKPQSSIYFSKEEDSNKFHISLQTDASAKKGVSDEDCKLSRLMKIPEVGKYFKDKGYAMSFEKNTMLLLPSAYINLYKGALGEAVGYAILNKFGIELKEIEEPSKFEKFDFEVVGADGVYIDFKHWSTDSSEDGEASIKQVEAKLKEIGGKKAFIINIVAQKDDYSTHDNGVVCRVPNIVMHKGTFLYIDNTKMTDLVRRISEVRN